MKICLSPRPAARLKDPRRRPPPSRPTCLIHACPSSPICPISVRTVWSVAVPTVSHPRSAANITSIFSITGSVGYHEQRYSTIRGVRDEPTCLNASSLPGTPSGCADSQMSVRSDLSDSAQTVRAVQSVRSALLCPISPIHPICSNQSDPCAPAEGGPQPTSPASPAPPTLLAGDGCM